MIKQKPVSRNVCIVHNADQILWCVNCKESICHHCLLEEHKSCDLTAIDEKTTELISTLLESVTSTQTKLIERFTRLTISYTTRLTDMRVHIKNLLHYENIVKAFLEQISNKQESDMKKLEEYENDRFDSSVTELLATISETLSLYDGPIIIPKIPIFAIHDFEEPALDDDSEDKVEGVAADSSTLASTFMSMVRELF